MSALARAWEVAIRVHAAQLDKQGEPYLLHVLRVAERVRRSARVVAVLHDVIEDGGQKGRKLVATLDLDEIEMVALSLLTRDPACSYDSYVAAINCRPQDDLAREVKIADLQDHLASMPDDPSWASLRRRYERALQTLQTGEGAV